MMVKQHSFQKMDLSQDEEHPQQEDDGLSDIVWPSEFCPLDEYTETEKIRDGSNGIAFYKAAHNDTGSLVTIKRIPKSHYKEVVGIPIDILHEVTILKEFSHPNIVTLEEVDFRQQKYFYLIFEYFAQDLKTFIDSHQTCTPGNEEEERVGLSPFTIKNLMRQLLAGVALCHESGILHRNLQPRHLLISNDGNTLKLAEFGQAHRQLQVETAISEEIDDFPYRAPELLLGCQVSSTSADIWSAGCIFAEMITGDIFFTRGHSSLDQLLQIFQKRGEPTINAWPEYSNFPQHNQDTHAWPHQYIGELLTWNTTIDSKKMDRNNAEHLLEELLNYNPSHRLSCRCALEHNFFSDEQCST